MRNVKRTAIPPSLKANATRWRRELLAAIARCKKNGGKTPATYYDKYRTDDVKRALIKMYGALCCFCESRVAVVEFGHIEHRKPKKKFPAQAFDWDNLHLACTRCNISKAERFDNAAQILDPVTDVPITDHLDYSIDENGAWRVNLTPRGFTTIEHADLNREELRLARLRVFESVMKVVIEIRRKAGTPAAKTVKDQLAAKCQSAYGSLITYAVKELIG